MPSWESVTALSTLGVTIITGAVAYGKLRQRVADMGKQIVINTQRVANCEEKASSSEAFWSEQGCYHCVHSCTEHPHTHL